MAIQRDRITWRDDLRVVPYLLPFFAVFLVYIAYPVVYSLWISMHQVTVYSDFYDLFGTMEFVGLMNYWRIVTDPIFWWSVLLTFVYALLTIVPGIAFSLFLALMLNRQARGLGFMRSGFFLPNVFDLYVVGVIWLLIYNPNGGLFSWLVLQVHGGLDFILPESWDFLIQWIENFARQGALSNAYTTLPAIALTMILKNAGFGMILFLTSLNNINQSIFEAADVDGASPMQKLWHITLPLLKPIILFLTITGVMGSLNAFAEIYAMTDDTGGTSIQLAGQTLQSARISGYHLYKVFDQSMYGEAAAISFCLLVVALVVSFANFLLLRTKN